MSLKKVKLARRFGEDIWGEIGYKGKNNKVMSYFQGLLKDSEDKGKKKFYVFRVDVAKPKRRRARLSLYGQVLTMRRKVCLFYGDLRVKKLMEYCKESVQSGSNMSNFVIGKLESRLATVVYRMNFAISIEEAQWMIRNGMISVNNQVIKVPSYLINSGDIVEVVLPYKAQVLKKLEDRVAKKYFYTSLPSYMEVNYKILVGIYLKVPKVNMVPYPFDFDEHLFNKLYDSRMR